MLIRVSRKSTIGSESEVDTEKFHLLNAVLIILILFSYLKDSLTIVYDWR